MNLPYCVNPVRDNIINNMGGAASSILQRCVLWDVGIQWAMWAVSSAFQTERFYDAAGSGTFAFLAVKSFQWGAVRNKRQTIQTSLVVVWAARLFLFLFTRILLEGHDKRFKNVRDNPKVFFIYWTVQALWIFLTLLPTLMLNAEKKEVALGPRDYIGWAIYGTGLFLESVSDYQKSAFKANPDNAGKFITSGFWSFSRHPNYLGEIMVWTGLYISASSVLSGWQHIGVISPLFVYFLLTRVSGIPMLEKMGMKRWGNDPNYLEYVKKTPVLFPSLW